MITKSCGREKEGMSSCLRERECNTAEDADDDRDEGDQGAIAQTEDGKQVHL